MYIRNCPSCGKELTYTTNYSKNRQEKLNKSCRSCTTKKEYVINPDKNKGEENGRFGKSLLEVMNNKYGEKKAEINYNNWKNNKNSFGIKEKNPQYGISPFKNNGMSYKGWYKGMFFRSSFELMFIFENYDKKIISAETKEYRVSYNYLGNETHYYPDFYSETNNTIYEIKSKKWLLDSKNLLKIEAGKEEFKKRGIKYEVLCEYDMDIFKKYNSDWQKIIYDFLYELVIYNEVNLTDLSFKKLKLKLLKTKRITKLKTIENTMK